MQDATAKNKKGKKYNFSSCRMKILRTPPEVTHAKSIQISSNLLFAQKKLAIEKRTITLKVSVNTPKINVKMPQMSVYASKISAKTPKISVKKRHLNQNQNQYRGMNNQHKPVFCFLHFCMDPLQDTYNRPHICIPRR